MLPRFLTQAGRASIEEAAVADAAVVRACAEVREARLVPAARLRRAFVCVQEAALQTRVGVQGVGVQKRCRTTKHGSRTRVALHKSCLDGRQETVKRTQACQPLCSVRAAAPSTHLHHQQLSMYLTFTSIQAKHLAVLQRARANGCPWNRYTCEANPGSAWRLDCNTKPCSTRSHVCTQPSLPCCAELTHPSDSNIEAQPQSRPDLGTSHTHGPLGSSADTARQGQCCLTRR